MDGRLEKRCRMTSKLEDWEFFCFSNELKLSLIDPYRHRRHKEKGRREAKKNSNWKISEKEISRMQISAELPFSVFHNKCIIEYWILFLLFITETNHHWSVDKKLIYSTRKEGRDREYVSEMAKDKLMKKTISKLHFNIFILIKIFIILYNTSMFFFHYSFFSIYQFSYLENFHFFLSIKKVWWCLTWNFFITFFSFHFWVFQTVTKNATLNSLIHYVYLFIYFFYLLQWWTFSFTSLNIWKTNKLFKLFFWCFFWYHFHSF